VVPRGEDSMVKASSSETCSFFASSCAKTKDETRMMGIDKIFIIEVCFDWRMVVQMGEIMFSQILNMPNMANRLKALMSESRS
jgi:hypothetical protein